jgi:hypothetical protein
MPYVWTVDTSRVSQLSGIGNGLQTIWLGAPAAHLNPGDVIVCYSTSDSHSTCEVSILGEIVGVDEGFESIVLDCRAAGCTIIPAPSQVWRWRKHAFLPLAPSRVHAYSIPEMLSDAFSDPTWPLRSYPDNTYKALYPDLDKPSIQPETGYVYLFKSPDWYKIGKTLNVEERRRRLSKEHGVELRILHSFRSRDYARAELLLLKRYQSKRKQGEWFFLDSSDIAEIQTLADFALDE